MMTISHAWRMAGRKHVAAAFASFWLSLAALPALAQFSDMGALTQRGVPAQATAENGVVAQERAFAAGRRAAWDRIQGMVDTTRRPTDAELDRMVRSIVIEQETTGPQRYSGRLTIQFDAEAVQSFAEGGQVRAATLPSGVLAPDVMPIDCLPASHDGSISSAPTSRATPPPSTARA